MTCKKKKKLDKQGNNNETLLSYSLSKMYLLKIVKKNSKIINNFAIKYR